MMVVITPSLIWHETEPLYLDKSVHKYATKFSVLQKSESYVHYAEYCSCKLLWTFNRN